MAKIPIKPITKLFFNKSISGDMGVKVVSLCLLTSVKKSQAIDDFETALLDPLNTAGSEAEINVMHKLK